MPVFARWTSNWDCGKETQWWYIIKDTPLDVTVLKAKRRYEINKGKKNFNVKIIEPLEYVEHLFNITVEAYSEWPVKYRPHINYEQFKESINSWENIDVFGAFGTTDNQLHGYAHLLDFGSYVSFSVLRTEPKTEKLAINAALVAGILEHYAERFDNKFYILDGSRSIRHETAFQDYLEKYFGFRKAYCNLHIRYRSILGFVIKCIFPFKELINDQSKIGSLVSAVLRMEEIRRSYEDD